MADLTTTFAIEWDADGSRQYHTGVNHGVLYPYVDDTTSKSGSALYGAGVAWNGLSSVQESPSGAESNPIYADDIKYLDLISNEEFGATIECYMYPDAFKACNGETTFSDAPGMSITQQTRRKFGLAYSTTIGDDLGNTYEEIHLVYGATASPSSVQHSSMNDSPEAETMSYELSTTKIKDTVAGKEYKTSHLIISLKDMATEQINALKEKLYGKDKADPALPFPSEVYNLIKTTVSGS